MSLPKPTIRVVLEGGRVKSVHSEIPVTCEVISRDDFNKPDRCFESFHAKEVPVAPCLKDSLLGREYRLFPTINAILRALLRGNPDTCLAGPAKDLDGLFPPRMSLSAHNGWILVTEVYAADRPLAQRNPTWLRVYKGSVVDCSAGQEAAMKVGYDGLVKRALEGFLLVNDLVTSRVTIPEALVAELETNVEGSDKEWKATIAKLAELRPAVVHVTLPLPVNEVKPEIQAVPAAEPTLLQTNSFEELLESEKKDPKFAKDFSEAQMKLMAESASADFPLRGQTSDAMILDEAGIQEELEEAKETPAPEAPAAPKKSAKKNAKKATEPTSEQDPAD